MARLNNSVAAQNDRMRAEIAACAESFRRSPQTYPWLCDLLRANGQNLVDGALVSLKQIIEQEGNCCQGVWINAERQFFAFGAIVSPQTKALAIAEDWRDVSDMTPVNEHVPGIGKSFGRLAIDVFEAMSSDVGT